MSRLGDYFAPIQLGVGLSGGCESAVHVTRCFMESKPNEFVIAKLDFTNAFNNLCRDAMLEVIYKTVLKFTSSAICHIVHLPDLDTD